MPNRMSSKSLLYCTHRQQPLVVVDLNEQLLEEVVAERVDHHHRQVGEGLHEDGGHGVVLARLATRVALGRPVRTLVQLLLQQPTAHLGYSSIYIHTGKRVG